MSSLLSTIASHIPGLGKTQTQPISNNSPNLAAMTVNMSPRDQTADQINQLAPQEIVTSNAFDINFSGTTQHLVVALTYKGHQAPLERAKLEHLTLATKAVFELTHETLKQQKLDLEYKETTKTITRKEKKELVKLNQKLEILNNISTFSLIQKGSDPYLKVVSKDANHEPLWIHLDSNIFEDIHTLAQTHVQNEVNRLQTQYTTVGLEANDVRKLDIMKYYLETRMNPLIPHPEIVQTDGRCFIQFKRDNGQIEPIEINSRLHPHVGAKHLLIDEFFQNFIDACNKIVENNQDFAKKVGMANQQQQLSMEQQRQLAAAQQQQVQQQTQAAAAANQAQQQQAAAS